MSDTDVTAGGTVIYVEGGEDPALTATYAARRVHEVLLEWTPDWEYDQRWLAAEELAEAALKTWH